MITIRQSWRRHFGLTAPGIYTDEVIDLFVSEIREAVLSCEMIALLGPVGSGKTHLVDRVQASFEGDERAPLFIHVQDLTPRKADLANILNACILSLSDEPPKHSMEYRCHQVARLLFEHATKAGRVPVIVIEDAHRLHHSTMRALKRLREQRFLGRPVPVSILMLGWSELASSIERRKEIAWRTTTIRLDEAGYMTLARREAFLEAVFGDALTPDARAVIATLGRVPAHMIALTQEAMRTAYHAGSRVVDERFVAADLRTVIDALGVHLSDVAREAGLAKSTVHNRIAVPRDDDQTRAIREAVARIRDRQIQTEAA